MTTPIPLIVPGLRDHVPQHWQTWLAERSGANKKAPTQLGNKKYPAGEAAPGTYVHER